MLNLSKATPVDGIKVMPTYIIEYTSRFESCSKIYWCFNVLLFISAWLMSSFVLVLRNENKKNLSQLSYSIKDKSRDKSWSFYVPCKAFLHPSNQTSWIKFWRAVFWSSWSWHACVCLVPTVHWFIHCTKGFTATFISRGALNQMGITSKILNRLLPMRFQNMPK